MPESLLARIESHHDMCGLLFLDQTQQHIGETVHRIRMHTAGIRQRRHREERPVNNTVAINQNQFLHTTPRSFVLLSISYDNTRVVLLRNLKKRRISPALLKSSAVLLI
ncbi:hypothetical protein D3C72_558810 [compost metagenome]